ncbi:ATP-binding cassette domain-containing protein [Streptomyces liangshanensis]|uniref:ABC-type xenobiotic transporter n=1 Tax=Streptomyces liangshanensis TaxID=2717324 RepID=A0A6G9GV88_9ACTN|nr:ATP-binding cassette domain-containing protein [Streptomyces liangshanensis]QIQ01847.1 ATP-binding cassette domain-containing protein [Streptomyces liangshanensis]
MTNAIVAEGLTKRFGDNVGLNGLDLTVRQGTVLGLLGPNGSGKTTTVRVLSTLLRADSGRAVVAGLDVRNDAVALRRKIGLSGQYAAVDEDLTARENLRMIGRLYHLGATASVERADELVERFGLTKDADRQVKGYSGGMRRRVDLACAVVSRPEVLFLDEPTTGLDVRSRMAMWEVIAELVSGGSTLLLTTQYLEEADQLADRITVMEQGKVVAEGTPDELKARVGGERLELTVGSREDVAEARRVLGEIAQGEITVDEEDDRVIVPITDGPSALVSAIRLLDGAGVRLTGTTVRRPSLDEVFLSLTGTAADPAPASVEAAALTKEEAR